MTMKTGPVMSCCAALLLALTSVSAVQRELDSINDLKETHSVSKPSLSLLYWFANAVDIDRSNVMRLTFDPESRAYGSHRYFNKEGILDTLPRRHVNYRYYTIGSLNQGTLQLPRYAFVGSNRDRIIIRIREPTTGSQVPQMIDQVYITQHLDNQREYDPDHTYMITTNLIRQIRQFSVGQNHQQLLQLRNRFGSDADVFDIINTWGRLAGLGLLLFIVTQERYSFTQQSNTLQSNYRPQSNYTHNSYTPQNYGHGNMQNNQGGGALQMCLLFVLVLIGVFIFMFSKSLGS